MLRGMRAVALLYLSLFLPLFVMSRNSPPLESRVWPAPAAAPAWAGYEVVGMDVWSGAFSNARVNSYLLTLRCRDNPKRRLERDYWPGPEWDGRVEWGNEAVTYFPRKGLPERHPYAFTLEEAQRRLGCGD